MFKFKKRFEKLIEKRDTLQKKKDKIASSNQANNTAISLSLGASQHMGTST